MRSDRTAPVPPPESGAPEPAPRPRNAGLDVLRLVLAWMVVGIHLGIFALESRHERATYLGTNGLFRVAVPLFFMMNGYYFRAETWAAAARWAGRLLILFVVWMAIYFRYWWPTTDIPFAEAAARVGWEATTGWFHLWYLRDAAVAGLIYFTLRKLSVTTRLAVAAALFLVGVATQYAKHYPVEEPWLFGLFPDEPFFRTLIGRNEVHRNGLLFGLPFLTLGAVLRDVSKVEIPWAAIAGTAVAATAALLAESAWNYANLGGTRNFDLFATLAVICPAWFLAVERAGFRGRTKPLATFATAVYVTHLFATLPLAGTASLSDGMKIVVCVAATTALSLAAMLASRFVRVLL